MSLDSDVTVERTDIIACDKLCITCMFYKKEADVIVSFQCTCLRVSLTQENCLYLVSHKGVSRWQ